MTDEPLTLNRARRSEVIGNSFENLELLDKCETDMSLDLWKYK